MRYGQPQVNTKLYRKKDIIHSNFYLLSLDSI